MAKKTDIDEMMDKYKVEDNSASTDMFKTMQKDKEQNIREMIRDIEKQIDNRGSLHKEMMADFKSIKLDISNFMTQNPTPADERASAEVIKTIGDLRN